MAEPRRRMGAALIAVIRTKQNSNAIFSPSFNRRSSYSTLSPVPDGFGQVPRVLLDNPPFVAVGMAPKLLEPRVVVYDGVCHLCHSGVKWIIKTDRDKKIKFCCLQSKAAEPYMKLCGLDRKDVFRRILFVEDLSTYYLGSSAALRVLSYMPFPYSALSALRIIPTPLRDAVYDYIAARRYDWFGKDDECLVLKETELLERFIDWEELQERIRSQKL